MRGKMITAYLKGKNAVAGFFKGERGAADIVAIIVIIVVVMAVAGIFEKELKLAIEAVFGKLTSFIGE